MLMLTHNIFLNYRTIKDLFSSFIKDSLIAYASSIGANIREAQRAVSKADFVYKLSISLKEADETKYWFELIDAKILSIDEKLKTEVEELIKILVSIINSTKKNNARN